MTTYTPPMREFIWLPETVLNQIATAFYGRTYIAQQTGDMLPNDSYHVYHMDEENVDELNADMDEQRHYLGIQRVAAGTGDEGSSIVSHYAEGVNWFEYWAALKFDPNRKVVYALPDYSNIEEAVASQREPAEWEDARSFVYSHETAVYRAAPTPQYVIADLIKNGILPYGEYMMEVWW